MGTESNPRLASYPYLSCICLFQMTPRLNGEGPLLAGRELVASATSALQDFH